MDESCKEEKKLESEMKKMNADVKGKSPTNTSTFTENGLKIQFQLSPKTTSTPYHDEAKAPRMKNKRFSNDRLFTSLAEPSSTLLVELLDAKLIKKLPF